MIVKHDWIKIKNSESYGIVLNSFFVHKAYLEMYFDPLMVPDGALEYVKSSNIICASIFLNIVVTKFLQDTGWGQQCGALAVENTLAIKVVDLDGNSGAKGIDNNYY